MSANNFWNSFKNGFNFGMLSNTPMFSCFSGFGGFSGFNNWFGGFNIFGGSLGSYWGNSSTSLFMVPNLSTNFYPLMSNSTPPTPNLSFDTSKLFDNSNIWNNNQSNNWQIPNNNNFFNMNTNNIWQGNWQNSWSTQNSATDTQNVKISYDATELKNTWSKKKKGLSNAFYNKVVDVAKNVNCSPNDLMALMYSESRLDASAVNKKSRATGLIQFMPNTAKSLGTSVEALRNMPAEEQLKYVEKYLLAQKRASKLGNSQLDAGTLYTLTFLPAYANKEVLATKSNDPKGYYSQNKGLDKNKDGKITKSELADRLRSYYA